MTRHHSKNSHDDAEGSIVITVNGDSVGVPAGTTVDVLVSERCRTQRGVAVAVDRDVVPRSAWTSTELPDGADVEIVEAAAGG